MKDRSNKTGYLIVSIVASLIFHAAFWVIAQHWELTPFYSSEAALQDNRRQKVNSIDLRQIMRNKPLKRVNLKKKLLSEQEKELHKLFEKENLVKKPEHRLKPVVTGLGKNILKPKTDSILNKLSPEASPPPKILQIKAGDLGIDRLLADRRRIPAIQRYDLPSGLVPSIVSPNAGGGGGVVTEKVDLGMRLGFDPRLPTLPKAPSTPTALPDITEAGRGGVVQGLDTTILDQYLDVVVSVHREPDGSGYFEVRIIPNQKSEALPSIPKDVLFLVDSSRSITTAKLYKFQQGLRMATDYLDPHDRFNVVAFRDRPIPLFNRFSTPTAANVNEMQRFIGSLKSAGKTDVYAGLAPYVSGVRESSRPYLVYLISDGQTTTGHKLENAEFIRRISTENGSGASILSFSTGENTNSFLLDFLSYKNRGFSVHQPTMSKAHEELSEYIGSLSEVLVADMACRITGDLQKDVYPRQLPHLYRGHALTVYGRFDAGVDDIGVQLVGRDQHGKRQELLVTRSLNDARPAGDELAASWASQKIVHLVAADALDPDPVKKEEIERLSKKYNIVLPY
jgi:hypothetical protein